MGDVVLFPHYVELTIPVTVEDRRKIPILATQRGKQPETLLEQILLNALQDGLTEEDLAGLTEVWVGTWEPLGPR